MSNRIETESGGFFTAHAEPGMVGLSVMEVGRTYLHLTLDEAEAAASALLSAVEQAKAKAIEEAERAVALAKIKNQNTGEKYASKQ